MFNIRLFLVLLVATTTAVCDQLLFDPVRQREGSQKVYSIHPTFQHGSTTHWWNNSCGVLKNENAITIARAEALYSKSGSYNPFSSFETVQPTSLASNEPVYLTENQFTQRQRLSETMSRGTSAFISKDGYGCHKFAYRSFELVAYRNHTYGLGFDQGVGACLILYKTQDIAKESDLFNSQQIAKSRLLKSPFQKTYYKISAIWFNATSPDIANGRVPLFIIDEAGYLYHNVILDLEKKEIRTDFIVQGTSSYKLDSLVQSKDDFTDNTIEKDIKEGASDGKGIKYMKEHYEHSYIEAIAFFKGSLVYSRGTFQPSSPPLRQIGASKTELPVFEELLNVINSPISIRALEIYMKGDEYLLHIGYTKSGSTYIEPKTYYMFCRTKDPKALRSINQMGSIDNENVKCEEGEFETYMMPVDIVHMDQCGRVVVFYQHLFLIYNDTGKVNTKDFIGFGVAEWMTGSDNAILHHDRRFYTFSSGNRLAYTEQIDICTPERLERLRIEANTTQSQLLLDYKNKVARKIYILQTPIFKSSRIRGQLEDIWRPPMASIDFLDPSKSLSFSQGDDVSPAPEVSTVNPIDDDRSTTTNPDGDNSTTSRPGPTAKPTSKPKTGNSSMSIIILVVIVAIIGAIVLGSIYYFCFGSSDDLTVVKPKTALRKQKTASLTSQQKQPTQVVAEPAAPVAGAAAANGSKASSGSNLGATPTVRSSMASSPSGVTSKQLGHRSKSGTGTTKSAIKSPMTAPKSVAKSPLGGKSARSPGARPMSKSKSKSPGTPSSPRLAAKSAPIGKSSGGGAKLSPTKSHTSKSLAGKSTKSIIDKSIAGKSSVGIATKRPTSRTSLTGAPKLPKPLTPTGASGAKR